MYSSPTSCSFLPLMWPTFPSTPTTLHLLPLYHLSLRLLLLPLPHQLYSYPIITPTIYNPSYPDLLLLLTLLPFPHIFLPFSCSQYFSHTYLYTYPYSQSLKTNFLILFFFKHTSCFPMLSTF